MAKRSEPSNRVVEPRGPMLRRLRIQHAWTVEELAERSGVGAKTISNAENARPLSPNKLAQIAEALGENYEDLVRAPSGERPRRKLIFKIEVDFEDFDPALAEEILKKLAAVHAATRPTIARGSILMSMRMELEDVDRACASFDAGKLSLLHVTDLRILPERPEKYLHVSSVSADHIEVLFHYASPREATYELRELSVGFKLPRASPAFYYAVPFEAEEMSTESALKARVYRLVEQYLSELPSDSVTEEDMSLLGSALLGDALDTGAYTGRD